MADRFLNQQSSRDDAADFDDKHDRVLHHQARIELGEGVDDGLAEMSGFQKTLLFCHEISRLTKKDSMLQQQVFKNRTQAESGEEGERAHDEMTPVSRTVKSGVFTGKVPGEGGMLFLRARLPAKRQHGDDHEKAAAEHGKAKGRVVPGGVGVKAGKGRPLLPAADEKA